METFCQTNTCGERTMWKHGAEMHISLAVLFYGSCRQTQPCYPLLFLGVLRVPSPIMCPPFILWASSRGYFFTFCCCLFGPLSSGRMDVGPAALVIISHSLLSLPPRSPPSWLSQSVRPLLPDRGLGASSFCFRSLESCGCSAWTRTAGATWELLTDAASLDRHQVLWRTGLDTVTK